MKAQFVLCSLPCLLLRRATTDRLLELILQVLGELLHNLVLTPRRETERPETFSDFFLEIRHVEFR